MELRLMFLICALSVEVKSDCDSPFGYLGDLVQEIFFGDCNNATNYYDSDSFNDSTKDFNSTKVDLIGAKNESIGVFDISNIGKSFSKALDDLTSFLQSELEGMFKLNHEMDLHKELNNETEIFVKTFGLTQLFDNNTADLPIDIVKNNFTEFNNDFEALKVEIEKNLQSELEAFISKITENDTLDWEDVTQTVPDVVPEKPKLENKGSTDMTELIKHTNTTDAKEINNVSNNTVKEQNNASISSEPAYTTIESENTNEITTNSPKPVSPKEFIVREDIETTKVVESANISGIDNSNIKIEDSVSTITIASSTIMEVTTSETAFTKVSTNGPTYLPTPKTETTTKSKVSNDIENSKLDAQTKSPIDYKLLENVRSNEISKEDETYYEIQDDNTTDYPIIDYVDLYKDTTNENIEYTPTEMTINNLKDFNNTIDLVKDDSIVNESRLGNELDNEAYTNDTSNPASIFPWIAAIFIRNESNNQFDYYCDGVLVSETHILTGARCLISSNITINPADVLVFLGKRSLQSTGENEAILRVKNLELHENFTVEAGAKNDLAILQLDDPAVLSDRIQIACLADGEETRAGVTTAWDSSLSLIPFLDKKHTCQKKTAENTFCATFSDALALCPSYGGVYASYDSSWCLLGIRSADPSSRGYCLEKTVNYTDLTKYRNWINFRLNTK